MKKLDPSIKVKICNTCKKKKIEEKFNKGKNTCKDCRNKRERERLIKKKVFLDRHRWDNDKPDPGTCIRCGVKRKWVTHPWKIGVWHPRYFINGEWVMHTEECKARKDEK